ncbi:uncharacterized protein METZ01_LOCUS352152, partial [marine metagenome]
MPHKEESKHALRRAIQYLVHRDRSRDEMVRYLRGKKFSENIVNETLIFLEKNDYINDERFALQFGKISVENKKIGKLRLGFELGNKGLNKKIIKKTLDSIYNEYDEKEIAMSCARKKLATHKPGNNDKNRRQIAQFLKRKGFTSNLIYEIVANLVPYTTNNDLDPTRIPDN